MKGFLKSLSLLFLAQFGMFYTTLLTASLMFGHYRANNNLPMVQSNLDYLGYPALYVGYEFTKWARTKVIKELK